MALADSVPELVRKLGSASLTSNVRELVTHAHPRDSHNRRCCGLLSSFPKSRVAALSSVSYFSKVSLDRLYLALRPAAYDESIEQMFALALVAQEKKFSKLVDAVSRLIFINLKVGQCFTWFTLEQDMEDAVECRLLFATAMTAAATDSISLFTESVRIMRSALARSSLLHSSPKEVISAVSMILRHPGPSQADSILSTLLRGVSELSTLDDTLALVSWSPS